MFFPPLNCFLLWLTKASPLRSTYSRWGDPNQECGNHPSKQLNRHRPTATGWPMKTRPGPRPSPRCTMRRRLMNGHSVRTKICVCCWSMLVPQSSGWSSIIDGRSIVSHWTDGWTRHGTMGPYRRHSIRPIVFLASLSIPGVGCAPWSTGNFCGTISGW